MHERGPRRVDVVGRRGPDGADVTGAGLAAPADLLARGGRGRAVVRTADDPGIEAVRHARVVSGRRAIARLVAVDDAIAARQLTRGRVERAGGRAREAVVRVEPVVEAALTTEVVAVALLAAVLDAVAAGLHETDLIAADRRRPVDVALRTVGLARTIGELRRQHAQLVGGIAGLAFGADEIDAVARRDLRVEARGLGDHEYEHEHTPTTPRSCHPIVVSRTVARPARVRRCSRSIPV